MARKPKRAPLTAHVSVGHHNNYTGMAEVATAEDVRYIRVEVPGLAWLGHVTVEFDAVAQAVEITVTPADENAPNGPRLRVDDMTSFTVRS